jgi:hypothetical protein
MKWKLLALRCVLASVFIMNLGLGITAFSSKDAILKVIHTVYRVPLPDLEEHTVYIIKMLGCVLIAIAVMAGLAIRNPAANRNIVLGNAIWLALRGVQRITYVERFHQDWHIPYAVLWGQVVLVFLVAASLVLLLPKKQATPAS